MEITENIIDYNEKYGFAPYADVLLKRKDRSTYSHPVEKDGKPNYNYYEQELLKEARKWFEGVQEQWVQQEMERLNDPVYQERELERYIEQSEVHNESDKPNYNKEFSLKRLKQEILKKFKDIPESEVSKLANKFFEENEDEDSILSYIESLQLHNPNIEEQIEELSFPIDALPYGIKEIVKAGHNAFNVGHEFFALPALVASATAIGSKFEAALNDTMTTKPILYACLIAMPGSGKSPAQKIAMNPLHKLQKEVMEKYKKDYDQYKKDIKVYEAREKIALKNGEDLSEEKPKKPRLQEYYTTNSTIEAVAKILQRSPQGIAYINDEFLAFYNSLNSYRSGKGSDLQEWLSLWNGNEIKINRKGDDIPVTVNDPYVSIVGNMTPSGIKDIASDSNTENGFLDRFLFSYATDTAPFDPAKTEGINKEIEKKYFNLIKGLLEMESSEENKYIRLSEDALQVYRAYWNKTKEIAGNDEKLRSIVAKLQMYSIRFGLIIHLCEQQNENNFFKPSTIQKESMEKAVQLCEYFRSQADKIYDKLATSESDELIDKATKVIKNKAIKEGKEYIISKRDLQRGMKVKADQINELIIDLVEREILKVKEEGKRGSVTYFVNPEVMV